jgi:monoamine oxidase
MGEEQRLVVIGAGMAGLACADCLVAASVDVLVLEARDRVGGRVWTLYDLAEGWPVEAGAMMVHGSDASLHRWIQEFGLRTRHVPILRGGRISINGRLRTTASFAVPSLGNLRTAAGILWTLPRAIARYRGPEITVAEFLATQKSSPVATRLVGTFYGSVNAVEPEELSVPGLIEEATAPSLGGLPWRNYQVREGFDQLALRRAATLGNRIRLRTRVDRIEWSPRKVRVHATGPGGPETHEAAAVVVTVPLGVLKAGDIAFEPPLPEGKRRAIESLGYGDVIKILLLFDPAMKRTILGRTTFLMDEDGGWYFFPHHGQRDGPLVIEGMVGGHQARALSGRPEGEVVETLLGILQGMLPGIDLRAGLHKARVIDWTSDPLCRGAYTFPALGAGGTTRRALAEPLDGTLFFAGEATHSEGEFATAHGAVDSGVRAAGEVLASLGITACA